MAIYGLWVRWSYESSWPIANGVGQVINKAGGLVYQRSLAGHYALLANRDRLLNEVL